jgi:hypothetical protein
MLLSHLVVVAIAALADAVPAGLKHAVHEKRDTPGQDWVKSARIDADAILPSVHVSDYGLTKETLSDARGCARTRYYASVSDPWFGTILN